MSRLRYINSHKETKRKEEVPMYRVDETGVMNNYADMPSAYLALPPTYNEQVSYIRQAAIAATLVVSVFMVAFGVS